MTIRFYTLTDIEISGVELPPAGNVASVRVFNDSDAAIDLKVAIAGNDGAAPEDVSDQLGKEIATEGWVYCRESGTTPWTQLIDPGTFPDLYDDLTGCFSKYLAAHGSADLEFKIEVPDDPATSGLAKPALVFMGVNA